MSPEVSSASIRGVASGTDTHSLASTAAYSLNPPNVVVATGAPRTSSGCARATPSPSAATIPTDSNPASKGSMAAAFFAPPKYRPAVKLTSDALTPVHNRSINTSPGPGRIMGTVSIAVAAAKSAVSARTTTFRKVGGSGDGVRRRAAAEDASGPAAAAASPGTGFQNLGFGAGTYAATPPRAFITANASPAFRSSRTSSIAASTTCSTVSSPPPVCANSASALARPTSAN